MRGGAAFDTILEQHLRGVEAPASADPRVSLHGVATAYGFFFIESPTETPQAVDLHSLRVVWDRPPHALESRFTGAIGAVGTPAPRTRNIAPRPAAVRASRASRMLTVRERQALDELIGLGARLSDDFTLPELRSSFRALALQYHPDRHASRTANVADLSARFARIADAYRVLARLCQIVD